MSQQELIDACKSGELSAVQHLVSLGADIRTKDDRAVRLAAQNGHLEVIEYLVSLGADIRARDNDAVQWAAQNGHLEVVKYLVSLGADIRARDNDAVQWASRNGHLEVVAYLNSIIAEQDKDMEECSICVSRYQNGVTVDCCSQKMCLKCSSKLVKCPYCRANFA